MIARMDFRKAMEANECRLENMPALLYSLGVDPRAAEYAADGYALKAVLDHLGITSAEVAKLDDDQLKLVELAHVAFLCGGATFLRAQQEYDVTLRHTP